MIVERRCAPLFHAEELARQYAQHVQVLSMGSVCWGQNHYPLRAFHMGTEDKRAPVVAIFGGVHGLERIGAEVAVAYMRTILELLQWDKGTQTRLEGLRLLFMPAVNPIGLVRYTRSNGNGVDLMRNAPSYYAEDERRSLRKKLRLFQGQRIGSWLPWFRGFPEQSMEPESLALCKLVREELFPSKLAIAIDLHSGFGTQDRLWFPYAGKYDIPQFLPEVVSLGHLLDRTHPRHVYKLEPVSRNYMIYGDLWDYLSDEYMREGRSSAGYFMPLTLEMGSLQWLRKNPLQIFRKDGAFHPVVPHRRRRILRRHFTLFDFLLRAADSGEAWLPQGETERRRLRLMGLHQWYPEIPGEQ